MNQGANHLVGGLVPALLGNGHPNVVPYGPMPTSDGQIIVGATGGDPVREVDHPAGPVRLVTSPITLDGRRPPVRRVPPLLGEHTEESAAPA